MAFSIQHSAFSIQHSMPPITLPIVATRRDDLSQQQMNKVASVLDAIPVHIVVLNEDGIITTANEGWFRFTKENYLESPEKQIGQRYLNVLRGGGDHSQIENDGALELDLQRVLSGSSVHLNRLCAFHTPVETIWLRIIISQHNTESGNGAVITHINVTEPTRLRQQLEHLARYDPLTELPNRTLLNERTTQAVKYAAQMGAMTAVLFLDLDEFKNVNNTQGNDVGDSLLRIVGKRLSQIEREDGFACRVGNDCFAVLLEKVGNLENVTELAERIQASLAAPMESHGQLHYITASVGISIYPQDASSEEELLRHADSAMYMAKKNGAQSLCFFNPESAQHEALRLGLEQDVKHAFENGEIELYYQPKVSCSTGRIIGVETLIRWQHPAKGLIPPDVFIPTLEASNYLEDVSEWILKTACQQAKAWHQAGLGDIAIAVNVSAKSIRPALVGKVQHALETSGLPAKQLTLELTESSLMKDTATASETLKQLKSLGVKLSIDDFGTGYSSLNYLRRFVLDELKIDRSFIENIVEEPDHFVLVRTIIAMAHQIGLTVVAEGVENLAQASLLISSDCDLIQGFIFSPAIPAPQFEALIRNGTRPAWTQSLRAGTKKETLLLVDDEKAILSSLNRLLHSEGYRILTATTPEKALEIMACEPIDVVISDLRMPSMGGVELLRRVKHLHPEITRIILSGHTDLHSVTDAINEGAAYKLLTKPWDDEFLKASIRDSIRHNNETQKNRHLGSMLASQQQALNLHTIVSVTNSDGLIVHVNDKFCAASGFSRSELIGKTHSEVLNSSHYPQSFFTEIWDTVKSGKTWRGEVCHHRKDGSLVWWETTIVPTDNGAGIPAEYVVLQTDITTIMELEQKLKLLNESLQKRIDEKTSELRLMVKQLNEDVSTRQKMQDELKTRNDELTLINKQLHDAQTQIQRSEKMASLGQLAASVSHEINNPIGYTLSNINTLDKYLKDIFHLLAVYNEPPEHAEQLRAELGLTSLQDEIISIIGECREGINRVIRITRNLKEFSRADDGSEWHLTDIHECIEKTLNIVSAEVKYKADIVKDYGDIPSIECASSQIQQVLLNLMINAAQAMDGLHGTITLRTRQSGEAVQIEISDTGRGIPAEIQQRIFEPFFTTKPVNQGTGLGLSVSYGIVKKHGGSISVESKLGEGSTFRVTLPIKRHTHTENS